VPATPAGPQSPRRDRDVPVAAAPALLEIRDRRCRPLLQAVIASSCCFKSLCLPGGMRLDGARVVGGSRVTVDACQLSCCGKGLFATRPPAIRPQVASASVQNYPRFPSPEQDGAAVFRYRRSAKLVCWQRCAGRFQAVDRCRHCAAKGLKRAALFGRRVSYG